MILERLVLCNVGVFRGRHELDLLPPNPERPIVLVGALNGSGKTTIIDSLQIGLYGRRAKPVQSSALGYEAYLRQLVSRNIDGEGSAAIEITFQIAEAGETRKYRICRSWSVRESSTPRCLDVYVNDIRDAVLSDNWQEEVDRFIPWNLAHLFFFDGERIEALADPAQSSEILRSGISSLLGVDLIDRLQADLRILRSRKKAQSGGAPEDDPGGELGEKLARVNIELESLAFERAQMQNVLDREENALDLAEASYANQGGSLFEAQQDLEKERGRLNNEIDRIEMGLRDLASLDLPLRLLQSQMTELRTIAESEQVTRVSGAMLEEVEGRDRRLSEWISEFKKDAALTKEVAEFLQTERRSLESKATRRVIFDLSVDCFSQLKGLTGEASEAPLMDFHELIAQHTQLVASLDDIERTLSRVPEEAHIRGLLEHRSEVCAEVKSLGRSLAGLDERIRSLQCGRSKLESEIRRLADLQEQKLIEGEDQQRFHRYCGKISSALENFQRRTLESHLASLEQHITTAFKKLLHKQSLVENVHIDPDTFEIRVFSSGGTVLPAHTLSAGERQLLAVALLWGLGQAAGRKLPIVIDTPLGRLDGAHRRNLVDRYFRNAGHQVILLSTDEEIDEEFNRDLEDAIAHRYLLHFDEDAQSTLVKTGYFW